MRFSSGFVMAAVAAMVGSAVAAPAHFKTVHPGDASDLIITSDNTINGTAVDPSAPDVIKPKPAVSDAGTQQLPLSFVNNFAGGQVNAYVTGLDPNNQVVLLQPDGTWFTPTSNGSSAPQPITDNVAIPLGAQGSTTSISLPDFISAARIWFAVGELQFYIVADSDGNPSLVEPSATNPADPSADVNWGFVELTNTADSGIYANISYVDFVGLVLGMTLTAGDGSTQTAQGLQANAVTQICTDLQTQAAADGQPWDQLCQADSTGTPLRVIAPSDFTALNTAAFSGYYSDYINQVWTQYASAPLTIDTQADAGNVSCTVQNNQLTCDGDNRAYAQPTEADIFGCNSGPFTVLAGDNAVHAAIVPRLCAAFERSTLLLPGGDFQPSLPSTSYYQADPTNWYSSIVHKYEIDGKGYAFAYDDVNPSGENESGVVSDPNPQQLQVIIGGPAA